MSESPYVAPDASLATGLTDEHVEKLRRDHLKHEASIQGVGCLWIMGGAFMMLSLVFTAWVVFTMPGSDELDKAGLFAGLYPFILAAIGGAISLVVGIGLRKLRPWSRVPGIVLATIGLLAFPVGTLINGYVLYLLVNEKGGRILSRHYQNVLAATPHIRYKTPIAIWIVLALFLAAIAFVAWSRLQ